MIRSVKDRREAHDKQTKSIFKKPCSQFGAMLSGGKSQPDARGDRCSRGGIPYKRAHQAERAEKLHGRPEGNCPDDRRTDPFADCLRDREKNRII